MRAIWVALVALLLCFSLSTLRLRFWPTPFRAKAFLQSFLVVLPLFALVHYDSWIEPVSALFLYTAYFFGGILQLYNLADRGFSLRILMDIEESVGGAMSLDEVMTGYSQGRGISWMYQKRVDDMLIGQMVTQEGEQLQLASKGYQIATIYSRLRTALHL